jgi:hypothetical protein
VRFSHQLIRTFGKLSKEVLAGADAKDLLARRVYDSYVALVAGIMDCGVLSDLRAPHSCQRAPPGCPLPFPPPRSLGRARGGEG